MAVSSSKLTHSIGRVTTRAASCTPSPAYHMELLEARWELAGVS